MLHHGACVGADAYAHKLAVERNFRIVVHPPVKTKFLARECLIEGPLVTVLPAKPYLNRDRDIVGRTEGVVATPKNHEPQGIDFRSIGGTWYTINYALRSNRPVIICYPSGVIDKREMKRLR